MKSKQLRTFEAMLRLWARERKKRTNRFALTISKI